MIKTIVFVCITIISVQGTQQGDGDWNGKWFPHSPSQPDLNPEVTTPARSHLYDASHGIVMGVKDVSCDDAKVNLTMDWYLNSENYTCYYDRHLFLPKSTVHPIHSTEHIPSGYVALHKCMNETIEYSEVIPTLSAFNLFHTATSSSRMKSYQNISHVNITLLFFAVLHKFKC